MAKEPKPELEPEEIPEMEEQPKPRSMRLYVLLGLISLILFQVMILVFFLPTPASVATQLREGEVITVPPDYVSPTDALPKTEAKPSELVEKPLGDKFQIQDLSSQNPGETDLFTVTVVLRVEKKNETAFDKLYTARTNTIRAIVFTVLRASTLEERRQDTLGAIKQKIRTRVNEELGANYVYDVVCTDASVTSM